ncbi:MAG: GGDEF domain-containing protein [Hyphomonadaceae bacterium]|nr:GGDEF domain-containing protein [Hyphomonadaceae bacterium]MCA8885919.1 GGDEF domain-containing protein [Hyphomonadaceae bacterium]
MLFKRSRVASGTSQVLQGLGLESRDVSGAGIAVLERLTTELAELKEKLEAAEALADRDTLAPVFNRRAFLRELHRTMSEVERYKTPAAVIYIDLDGFKAVNDEYGHSAGDAVLRHVGLLLIDSVRESDVVGRLGGDEFGIILNRASAAEAAAKAASLNDKINSSAILYAGVPHRIRASVGVHPIALAEDPETALARADEAMYAEKHARRAQTQAFAGF